MSRPTVIAIDGPAASGKSTVGRQLAAALGYLFLDTGLMYRAVTLAALRSGLDPADEKRVVDLTGRLVMEIVPAPRGLPAAGPAAGAPPADGRLATVLLDGADVTDELRTPDVDAHVSQVSAYQGVREEMVRQQRIIAGQGPVVVVGRDIGTVVMPDAPLKLYVTATAEERARRRWLERREHGGAETYEEILADVRRRDAFDSGREHSPLRPAGDAIVLDTTDDSPTAVVREILKLLDSLPAEAVADEREAGG